MCRRGAVSAIVDPGDALPGRPGGVVALDATALASEASDAAQLEVLLEEAGYVGGAERSFSKTAGGRRRALARLLVFENAEGADRYLAWLEGHVVDLIGSAEPLEAPTLPGPRFLVVHEASACCPHAATMYLTAWRRGHLVLTLEVGGQGVDADDVSELAAAFDDAI